ncbi:MAG: ABC transporter ATP-binding protein [Bacteroidaceae bacterium]|nr:ABC transporter ATP-binding protein [Bacteroidaceae bacterium]
MICVEGIKKSFGDLTVLKGINLNVQNKEFVCIVGPSGAGKTTLLQILGSLYKPDEGSIRINGIDILSLSRKEIAKFRNRHIGFIFQFHQLLPEFNALENIMLPGLIAGKPSKEVQTRAKELLAYMGLSDRATHKPSELSGGEKQRVAVARALINQPSIILADEPSGSLDSQNKEELYKLFFKLRQEFGLTFVIVTHDETLSELADRTIHMLDGNIISTDTTTFTNDTIRPLE